MANRTRTLLRRFHLWLGLSLGGLFALLSLTGSVLVFYVEIDRMLHREIRTETHIAAPGWFSPAWDRALATARAKWPERDGKYSFEVTGQPRPIPARFYDRGDHSHHTSYPQMLWFSPDGGTVVREVRWGRTLVTWFYDIHRHLLIGEPGTLIVGWSGVGMLVLLLTGIAAWWPRGSWRKAMAFKRNAAPLRRQRDLHKLFGLASFLLLFILVLTGVFLALPQERNQIWAQTIGAPDNVPAPVSTTSSGTQVTVAAALSAAHAAIPGARLAWIDVPGSGDGVFRVRAQVPGDPNHRFPYSFVFVDQYSGKVLAVHDARRGNAATVINNWIRPLHDASVGGLGTRILGVILGLVPALLFVTGILHWLRRRRAARRLHPSHSSN